MVNVLVVGSGGREHAISWKISKSKNVEDVFTAPGNGGTENNIPIQVDQIDELADFASKKNCFTIVGPEAPLANGIVDAFNKKNLKIFGPTQDAAQLESSKIWAKEFLHRNNIPTAEFQIFDNPEKAKQFVNSYDKQVVIKADGLAAGKGVIVCNNKEEAFSVIDKILIDKAFGDAGSKIIMSTHDLGQARRLADEILFLHRGRLIAHAPAGDILNDPTQIEVRAFINGDLFW